MVIKDFEGIREENSRLRLQAEEAQDSRKSLQAQFDQFIEKYEFQMDQLSQ
jgi:hypothetical protein